MVDLRIQRRRTPGFRLPPNTICCSRPGPYGNPFPVDIYGVERAIDMFNQWLTGNMSMSELSGLSRYPEGSMVLARVSLLARLPSLAGKNLACWCRLCPDHAAGKPLDGDCAACAPCHVDAIGRLVANG